jgi:hypothetical protein
MPRHTNYESEHSATSHQLAEQRLKLGDAPEWAYHLHDCFHAAQRLAATTTTEVREHRAKMAVREKSVDDAFSAMEKKVNDNFNSLDADLKAILKALGGESEDGNGGKGLTGQVMRNARDIKALQASHNQARGIALAVAALVGAITLFFKATLSGMLHDFVK